MATSYLIQAAESGKLLNLTQSTGGVNFTNATCKLLVTDPTGVQKSYNCTIDPTNKFAQYLTTGLEFPVAGTFQVQLQYVNAGERYFSAVTNLKVLPNLI